MTARSKRRHHWLDFGGFYQAQPAWARRLYWFATIPTFLLWGCFIMSGTIQARGDLALIVFGVLFVLAAIHNFYFVKAVLGGDR